ncbi:uncharacterized protein EMH_0022300 [Eimeria mitis]|uniref:Uncharacterized protein n=1 Tax=Eimeria mitis TaxID=44415 RepID=U6KDC5_9EIME|nr:uncharacterized protein EMH_0022300 [Eimeria mitis]CDJ34806.1 hypothetical protein, conserved [Eimeria mitis]
MHAATEGPQARRAVPAPCTPFPSLPFLTDAYLPAPQCAAAAQQQLLLLQPGAVTDPVCAAGAERLIVPGAEGWADSSGPLQQLQLLGGPRDGEVGEFLSGAPDPTSFAASYFSHLCSHSLDNPQTPTTTNSHSSLSPIQLAAIPETGSGSSVVGAAPPGGVPLYCGAPFPFSVPSPLTCGLAPEGPPRAPNPAYTLPQQTATQDTHGLGSDYIRFTTELCEHCATMRDIVTDNLSFTDKLNSTMDRAAVSAGQVIHEQQKLLLSANQQKHLVADSKVIHSKVHTLHRILQKDIPQYNQWLEKHPILKEHIHQLEQQHRDFVGSGDREGNEDVPDSARNSAVSRRRSSSSSNHSKRRKSMRQYKRQQLAALPPESTEGLPLPVVKTERTTSCT